MAKTRGCYVQIGAGFSNPAGWCNYDASPTLRLQRVPVIGSRMARLAGNAAPFPEGVVYGDVVKGLPHPPGTVDAVYASHVLEHLSLDDMRTTLRNCLRLLKPGGVMRLIVPDLLQRAKDYVAAADSGDPEAALRFMHSSMLGLESRPTGLLGRLRAVFGNSLHLWMWDIAGMSEELKRAGFVNVRPAVIGDSGDPMFDAVESEDRFVDGPYREVALQAQKPVGRE